MANKRRITGDIGPDHVPPVQKSISSLDLQAILEMGDRTFPAVRIDPKLSRIVGSARRTRPILTTSGGQAVVDGPPWAGLLGELSPAISAVCKINPGGGWSATGVLLTDNLVLTNEHVAARLRTRARLESTVWFGWETDEHQELRIVDVESTDEALDLAVLRLASKPNSVTAPSFAFDRLPDVGASVAAIGYPAFVMPGAGHTSDELADQLLGGPSERGRKRVSPGVLRAVGDELLHHDCSTVHGSSGSPIVELATGLVVGIHAGGGRGPGPRLNRAAPIVAATRLGAVSEAAAASR